MLKQYILRILKSHFMTQSDFAEVLGIDRSHLGKLINGKHKPSYKTMSEEFHGLARVDGTGWEEHRINMNQILNPNQIRLVKE